MRSPQRWASHPKAEKLRPPGINYWVELARSPRSAMKKRKAMWLTKMYWFGPFVDLSGNPVGIRATWAIRFRQFAERIWTVRKGRRLVANIFFTFWVSTDIVALIQGTTPPLPLSIWGAIFGSALVLSEWCIFWEEFRDSAPLHVLWQPRISQPPQQPYLYVHFESKNYLPFEARCTFANDRDVAIGVCPSEYQEFVPNNANGPVPRPRR